MLIAEAAQVSQQVTDFLFNYGVPGCLVIGAGYIAYLYCVNYFIPYCKKKGEIENSHLEEMNRVDVQREKAQVEVMNAIAVAFPTLMEGQKEIKENVDQFGNKLNQFGQRVGKIEQHLDIEHEDS